MYTKPIFPEYLQKNVNILQDFTAIVEITARFTILHK